MSFLMHRVGEALVMVVLILLLTSVDRYLIALIKSF